MHVYGADLGEVGWGCIADGICSHLLHLNGFSRLFDVRGEIMNMKSDKIN